MLILSCLCYFNDGPMFAYSWQIISLCWPNVVPTRWTNVGTLCTYNIGPTLLANVGPTMMVVVGPTLAHLNNAVWVPGNLKLKCEILERSNTCISACLILDNGNLVLIVDDKLKVYYPTGAQMKTIPLGRIKGIRNITSIDATKIAMTSETSSGIYMVSIY